MKLEQQQELMARLSIMQKLSLAEAMEILNVSESTIRRIFAKMEKEGVAIRTHGGIQSASGAMPLSMEQKRISRKRRRSRVRPASC